MGPTILQREVLPSRQAPCDPHDFMLEAQVRTAITRLIWMSAVLVGLANVISMLGTWL
jgi:hypothetical protein